MPKTKKEDFTLLRKIQKESKWHVAPEAIERPTKKLKTSKSSKKSKETKKSKAKKSKSKKTGTTTHTHFPHRYIHDANEGKSFSFLARSTPLKGILSPKSARGLSKAVEKIKGYTPVQIVESSERGTPLIVKSKGGKVLHRHTGNNMFHFFGEKKPETKKTALAKKLTLDPDFVTKKVSVTITEKLLLHTAKQYTMNDGERCVSQNSVMKKSATKHAHEEKISLGNKLEWGHLVAHRFLSDLSQHMSNLAAITDHANTDMIAIEDFVATLASKKLGPIQIIVTANLISETEIASSIAYDVHIAGLVFNFNFDGQQPNKPDIAYQKVMEEFCKVLLDHKKLEGKKTTKPLVLSADLPFFSKSAEAAKKAKTKKGPKICPSAPKKAKFT